jgi:hypothetical protein
MNSWERAARTRDFHKALASTLLAGLVIGFALGIIASAYLF